MRLVLLVILLAASSAHAQPELAWRAPASCPDADSVRARIEQRLGHSLDDMVVGIAVEVTGEPGHFVAEIEAHGQTRTLIGARCDELVDAVAVIATRLAHGVVRPPPAPKLETVSAPPPPPAPERGWSVGARLSALSAIGMVPKVGVGGELALGVYRRTAFAELAQTHWLDSTQRLSPEGDAGVVVGLDITGIRLGWRPPWVPMRAWVAGEVGTIRGSGVGFTSAQSGTGHWSAVVILGDEDDCSASSPTLMSTDTTTLGPLQSFRCFQFGVKCASDAPTATGAKTGCVPRVPSDYVDAVDPFATFLVDLKHDPRMVMVSAIVGPPTPIAVQLQTPPGGGTAIPTLQASCSYMSADGLPQEADPAVRIASLLDHFPLRSKLTSICNPDLSDALADIGLSAKQLMGDTCVDLTAFADTGCEVLDVRDTAPEQPTEVPRCGDTIATNCYELVSDPIGCAATPDHMRLDLRRTGTVAADTWTYLRCQPR